MKIILQIFKTIQQKFCDKIQYKQSLQEKLFVTDAPSFTKIKKAALF